MKKITKASEMKVLMQQKRIRQAELARKIQVADSVLSKYINGWIKLPAKARPELLKELELKENQLAELLEYHS